MKRRVFREVFVACALVGMRGLGFGAFGWGGVEVTTAELVDGFVVFTDYYFG